ncbi:MAG: MogA/MoaB family molybdenum cofactor biosynthesis protein [Burkholderiales bacterium]|nr:MogA/MoaB family molybdenum cofactor biosynthesis protein [Phycisphaerae bacterium]
MAYTQHQQQAGGIVPRCGIITLSDTRTPETDTSGQLIKQLLIDDNAVVDAYTLIRDEPTELRAILNDWLASPRIDVIITNGGTGISGRDQTVEVIASVIQTPLPGFGELFRMLSYEQIGSGALLSRAMAGIARGGGRGKVIFALPGSTKAVALAMEKLILREYRHILRELNKDSGEP